MAILSGRTSLDILASGWNCPLTSRTPEAMGTSSRCAIAVAVLACWMTSCRTSRHAVPPDQDRIIRVATTADSKHWRLSVNGGGDQALSYLEFTNLIARLGLGFGDIVLWESIPAVGPGADDDQWFARHCSSKKTAMYVHS